MYSVRVRTRFAFLLFPLSVSRHRFIFPLRCALTTTNFTRDRSKRMKRKRFDDFAFSTVSLPSIAFSRSRSVALDFPSRIHKRIRRRSRETRDFHLAKESRERGDTNEREIVEARARRNDSSTHSYSTVVTSCSCEV